MTQEGGAPLLTLLILLIFVTAAAESALTSLHDTLRLPGARRCIQVWVADDPGGGGRGSSNGGGDNRGGE